MQKIPVLFLSVASAEGNENFQVRDAVRPGLEWVMNGEGVATLKKDGAAAAIINQQLYTRYDRKLDKKFHRIRHTIEKFEPHMYKAVPEGTVLCNAAPDPISGHWPSWVPCSRDEPSHKYLFEAFDALETPEDGTYELIGPTVRLNPYQLSKHVLYKHGADVISISDYSFEGLREVLKTLEGEGIVFHHKTDATKMAKLRRKDFGFDWNEAADPRNLKEKGAKA